MAEIKTPKGSPSIDMTPMVDIAFLLLIFFMLSTRFIDEGRLQLRLPEAGVVPEATEADDRVVIEVTAQGGYRVNGRALINNSPDTLAAAIGKAAGNIMACIITSHIPKAKSPKSGP